MKNLKASLIVLAAAVSLSLAACSKKQEEQSSAEPAAVSETVAVTSIEVSPDMIDAAPLEQEGSAASEASVK